MAEKTKTLKLHTADLVKLTAYSEAYCRRLLNKIRREYTKNGRTPKFVTVEMYADWSGIEVSEIEKYLTTDTKK